MSPSTASPIVLLRTVQRKVLSLCEIWWSRQTVRIMLLLSVLQTGLNLLQTYVLHQTLETPVGLPWWAQDTVLIGATLFAWMYMGALLRPLSVARRCHEAWALVQSSPGADAVRHHVLHLGRALIGQDLVIMRSVARRERWTNSVLIEQEREACRRLHETR